MKKLVVLLLLVCSPFVFAQTWVKVSCGGEFSVALRSDGTMWAWGFNGNGQLGLGTLTEEYAPVQVGTDNDWSDIAAGGYHTIAVKNNGTLWGCGFNGYGMLGDGTDSSRAVMTKIGSDNDWSKVSASFLNSFAIKNDGSLYGWGVNNTGQLADSFITRSLVPRRIGTNNNWVKVSPGAAHVLGLTSDNRLWVWGANGNGELGLPLSVEIAVNPRLLNDDIDWVDISAGFQFSAGLKSDHSCWTWGYNGNGQLGQASTLPSSNIPRETDMFGWKMVVAGPTWMHGVTLDGRLWGWGFNGAGQLGSSAPGTNAPMVIQENFNGVAIATATGIALNNLVYGTHAIIIRSDRTALCGAGGNYVGQLGMGAPSTQVTPFQCTIGVLGGVENIVESVPLSVYPNPATDVVTISVPGASDMQIEFVDILGNVIRTVMNHTPEYSCSLSEVSSTRSAAAYVIRVQGELENGKHFRTSRMLYTRR